jgi:hypothetical protein
MHTPKKMKVIAAFFISHKAKEKTVYNIRIKA